MSNLILCARDYNPVTGRFISEDPIGFAGGDVNFYRYVHNSVTQKVDPSGNSPLIIGAAIAGGFAGGLAAGVYSSGINEDLTGLDYFTAVVSDVTVGAITGAAVGVVSVINPKAGMLALLASATLTGISVPSAILERANRDRLRKLFPQGYIDSDGNRVGDVCK